MATAYDEFASYTPRAKAGVLYVRSLPNEVVLSAARDCLSEAFMAILEYMGGSIFAGGRTNPSWITARCADEAYDRGLLDEQEYDWIVR